VVRLPTAAFLLTAAVACAGPRAGVRRADDAAVRFTYDGDADEVYLTGDMTRWRPTPLVRAGRTWSKKVPVPRGRWEYRLEVHRRERVDVVLPADAERVDDGFGGENAVLRMP
jgi:hypothetical protein